MLVQSKIRNLSEIKQNPKNPRIIKDDKFRKLVESIKSLPKMLELRPIVVDDNDVVLGGNMRLKACQEAGLSEAPVMKISDFTEEQKQQFIIKDNVGFGEWEWDILANEWDAEKLIEWGLEVWQQSSSINEIMEGELDLTEGFDPIGESSGLQRVVFIFDGDEEAESYLMAQKIKYKKRNMAWQVNMTSNIDL